MIAGVRGKSWMNARSLGVSDVLAIDDDAAIEKFRLVDAIADTVGGEIAAKLIAKVKQGGSFGYAAALPQSAAAQNPGVKITRVGAQPDPSKVREFADDVRDGKFVLPIGRRMPLRDAAEAHVLGEKGGIGKIILLAPDHRTDLFTANGFKSRWRYRIAELFGVCVVAGAERRLRDQAHVFQHFRRHAELFFGLLIGNPAVLILGQDKRLGEDGRIVDRRDHLHVIVIHAGVAFLDVSVHAMGMAVLIEPGLVAQAGGFDHQRVIPIPVGYRISVIARWHSVLGVELRRQWVFAVGPGIAPNPLILLQDHDPVRHRGKRDPSGLKFQIPWNAQWIARIHWVIRVSSAHGWFRVIQSA